MEKIELRLKGGRTYRFLSADPEKIAMEDVGGKRYEIPVSKISSITVRKGLGNAGKALYLAGFLFTALRFWRYPLALLSISLFFAFVYRFSSPSYVTVRIVEDGKDEYPLTFEFDRDRFTEIAAALRKTGRVESSFSFINRFKKRLLFPVV